MSSWVNLEYEEEHVAYRHSHLLPLVVMKLTHLIPFLRHQLADITFATWSSLALSFAMLGKAMPPIHNDFIVYQGSRHKSHCVVFLEKEYLLTSLANYINGYSHRCAFIQAHRIIKKIALSFSSGFISYWGGNVSKPSCRHKALFLSCFDCHGDNRQWHPVSSGYVLSILMYY